MERVKIFRTPDFSTAAVRKIAGMADTDYTLIYTRPTELKFVDYGLERMVQVADDSRAAMVYADHFNGSRQNPVIDYQLGSLRDEFDFGGVLLYRSSVLLAAVAGMEREYEFAGLYDLRLRSSRIGRIVHINEFLYSELDPDKRSSGEKLFDYVNPRNRAVQLEMEAVCTEHLKAIGAYLPPRFKEIDLTEGDFEYEASVVIPCKDRARTIGDAVRSALSQKTDFPYNVIVVDDNSTDGTTAVLKEFEGSDKFIHIAQEPGWHAIGGNWNAAIHHPKCGRFAIQLDSDDVYSDENTVQKFVDAFREQKCAAVIGSYSITDFELNPVPPGIIDHREWTPGNGRNNALRINGLGAPRAYFVPLLRQINFPTVLYGEDYSVVLRICREYRIGRIYDVMYFCRRWAGNSDAALPLDKVNAHDIYKDRVRSWEILARIALNQAAEM